MKKIENKCSSPFGSIKINAAGLLFVYMIQSLLIRAVDSQLTRLTQYYPQPTTPTPYAFSSTVTTGFFISDQMAYVHGEYSGTTPSISVMRKDGSTVQVASQNSLNSAALVFLNTQNTMVSFGKNSDIRLFSFLYLYPNFFALQTINSVAHNRNLNQAIVNSITGTYYVSTTTGGAVYKYDSANLNVSTRTMIYPDFSSTSIDALAFLNQDVLVIGGTTNIIKFIDSLTLAEISSFPISESNFKEIIFDTIHLPVNETYLDTAADKLLVRYQVVGASLKTIHQVGPLIGPITNLVALTPINYLLITFGTNIDIIKRPTYDANQRIITPGMGSITAGSIACCDFNLNMYTFTAAIFNSTGPSYHFASFQLNLDFCSNYDSITCTQCDPGYKLNSTDPNNECISQEEYPPQYGSFNSTLAPCVDPLCLRCFNIYTQCEVCPLPYYISQDTYNCTNLTTTPLFGKDLTNSSIIWKCIDPNCLICIDDYQTCTLCQEELFDLSAGTCINKDTNLSVINTWFNESESKAYAQFSDSFKANGSHIYPTNLTVAFTDSQGDPYTDYTDFSLISNSDNSKLILAMTFHTSIYAGQIILSQVPVNPVFYNNNSYLPQSTQIIISDVRQIKAPMYFLLLAIEKPISVAVWAIMISSALLGTVYDPMLGSIMMKTVSYGNLISHLNGPALHASDVYFDIIGKVNLPVNTDKYFQTPIDQTFCVPEANYQKRYQGYSSCNILDLYTKSILFYCAGLIISFTVSFYVYFSIRKHRKRLQEEYSYKGDPSLATQILVNRYTGIRLMIIIYTASSPIILQYSFLTLFSNNTPYFAMCMSGILVVTYILLLYCLFRFTYNYLDVQYVRYIKLNRISHEKVEEGADKSEPVSPLKEGKDINIVMPKENSTSLTKDGKIKIAKIIEKEEGGLNKLDGKEDNRAKKMNFDGSVLMDNSAIDDSIIKSGLDDNSSAQTIIQLGKVKFSILSFFITGYKVNPSNPMSIFYYIPLIELTNNIIASYTLVRFSGNGLIQPYIIFAFEFITLLLTLLMQPYEKKIDFVLIVSHKSFISVLMLIRLFSFVTMPEENIRQKIIDVANMYIGMAFVGYSCIIGIYSIVRGIKKLFSLKEEKEVDLKMIKIEKKEIQSKTHKHDDVKVDDSVFPGAPDAVNHMKSFKTASGQNNSPVKQVELGAAARDRVMRANRVAQKKDPFNNVEHTFERKQDKDIKESDEISEVRSVLTNIPKKRTTAEYPINKEKKKQEISETTGQETSKIGPSDKLGPTNPITPVLEPSFVVNQPMIKMIRKAGDGDNNNDAFLNRKPVAKKDKFARQLDEQNKIGETENSQNKDNSKMFAFKSRAPNLKNITTFNNPDEPNDNH